MQREHTDMRFLFIPIRKRLLVRTADLVANGLTLAFGFFLIVLVPLGIWTMLAYLLRGWVPVPVESGFLLLLITGLLLARFPKNHSALQRILHMTNGLMPVTLTIPSGRFALGVRPFIRTDENRQHERQEKFRLDEPGWYLLKPKSFVAFLGTEEEYSAFDPLSL